MIHFLLCIQDYGYTINYYNIYSKVVHNYFFKDFYARTNKKKYKLQILKHNVYNINVISMLNLIPIAKSPVCNSKKKAY